MISNSARFRVDLRSGILSQKLPKGHSKQIIEPSLSIRSGQSTIRWQSCYFHIQSFLMFLISRFENGRILIEYLFAFIQTPLFLLAGLQSTGFNTLSVLLTQFEIDFHTFLPFGGVDCFDICTMKNVTFYHELLYKLTTIQHINQVVNYPILFDRAFYNSMSLQQEIAQLCQTIYSFETQVQQNKEQLFSHSSLTPQFIWNHMIGQKYKKATSSQLLAFFRKHGLQIQSIQINLITWQFSSNKDNQLSLTDIWQIFRPLTVKYTQEIAKNRQNKNVIAKNHQAHYKISDLLCTIMKNTIDFLKVSNLMKRNIVNAKPQSMIIEPLDPIHLMMYINDHAPSLMLRDVQIIFEHIMRNQTVCRKTFEQYFIPLKYAGGDLNPTIIREAHLLDQNLGIELLKHHTQNVAYLNNSHKKVFYLYNQKYSQTQLQNTNDTVF